MGVLSALAIAAQQPASTRASSSADASLPAAPSAVLERLAKQDAELGKTAGSGRVYTPAATVKEVPGAPGEVVVEQPAGGGPLALSLDDAISFGLKRNVRVLYDQANQREVQGLTETVFGNLVPDLRVTASTSTQEINLAALGFRPQTFAAIAKQFNLAGGFPTVVKVNSTQVLLSASQQLFNLPDLVLWRAAASERNVVDLNSLNSRGEVVVAVASAYLRALADQSNVENAEAQERAAQTLFEQTAAKLQAGVGTRLDALRGQVDYQQRQQATVAARNQLEKDLLQLNRIMGLPAHQPLELTDKTPFRELEAMDLELAKTTAYAHRKDFLSLEAQRDVAQRELRAVRYQRLPTLAFNGFYGVQGVTTGLYHGVFQAQGSLRFPIFREAAQRGEQDTVSSQVEALGERLESTRVDIEAQIRSAMLDVDAAHELVKVAQANVELTRQELADERDRFAAGIDDNLPVIDAEAAVSGAEAQLVNALFQYNVAKLNLARNTGVVESRYRTYLGL